MQVTDLVFDYNIVLRTGNYAHIITHYGWVSELSIKICPEVQGSAAVLKVLDKIAFAPSYNLTNYEEQAQKAYEWLIEVKADIAAATAFNMPLHYYLDGMTLFIEPVISAAQPASLDAFVDAKNHPIKGYAHITGV